MWRSHKSAYPSQSRISLSKYTCVLLFKVWRKSFLRNIKKACGPILNKMGLFEWGRCQIQAPFGLEDAIDMISNWGWRVSRQNVGGEHWVRVPVCSITYPHARNIINQALNGPQSHIRRQGTWSGFKWVPFAGFHKFQCSEKTCNECPRVGNVYSSE